MAAAWVYRKLYTGNLRNALDTLIVEIAPEVRTLAWSGRWFFVRFADEGGVHLRLRAVLADGDVPDFDRLCEDALRRLSLAPPFLYRPAVPSPPAPQRLAVMHIRRETYIPETGKFGARGMGAAEALFAASSEIAAAFLGDEDHGLYSRKDVAHALMDAVRDVFAPESVPSAFWEAYAEYWLARSGLEVAVWRDAFTRKTGRIAAAGMLPDPGSIPAAAAPYLAAWRTALATCAEAYRSVGEDSVPRPVLATNFAHLMNNRLGLLPVEDAYYALILRTATENSGHVAAEFR